MKKLLILAAAAALAVSMTACGMGEFNTSGSSAVSTASGAVSSEAQEIDQSTIADDLDGIVSYLGQSGVLKLEGAAKTDMSSEFIGAKKGVKYTFGNEGTNNVTVEIYEYDLENITPEAKGVLAGVKDKEQLSVMSQTVSNAFVSDNGKYLMIYNDSANGEKNTANRTRAIELFKGFKNK